jgi:hypothetical protein
MMEVIEISIFRGSHTRNSERPRPQGDFYNWALRHKAA